jgi:hypothetical protein
MPHATQKSGVRVVPLVHGKDKHGVDFGAEVYGVDLNSFSGNSDCSVVRGSLLTSSQEEEFKVIEAALYEHKVLIFKEQPGMLHPSQQYKLTKSYVGFSVVIHSSQGVNDLTINKFRP